MNPPVKRLIRYSSAAGMLMALSYFACVYVYGLRLPDYQFANFEVIQSVQIPKIGLDLRVQGGYIIQLNQEYVVRAYSPHLQISLTGNFINFPLAIENIHPKSSLLIASNELSVHESVDNINRLLMVDGQTDKPINLKWVFPVKPTYRFMAIGDTGGGKELQWATLRAAELGADFIMHLGDLFYSHQDVQSALTMIKHSPIPVYNVYGNHDYFNHDYPEIDTFEKFFSPANFHFQLLDKTFISLDTSSHIIPFNRGKRGEILQWLDTLPSNDLSELLLFTHQPIADSYYHQLPELEHGLTGPEGRWLENRLKELEKNITVVAGHVHKSLHVPIPGLPTYIAGEGLAIEDLLQYKPVSKVLIGEIAAGVPVDWKFMLNMMPPEFHTHIRAQKILETYSSN